MPAHLRQYGLDQAARPLRLAAVRHRAIADGSTDLKNFKILGDDIAIDGSISLDPEQHLKSFYFSDFSFDRLTHVEINAAVRDGNVLEVEAHGPSYNGKQFFQSLFSAGQIAEDADPRDPFERRSDGAARHRGRVLRLHRQRCAGHAQEAEWPAR